MSLTYPSDSVYFLRQHELATKALHKLPENAHKYLIPVFADANNLFFREFTFISHYCKKCGEWVQFFHWKEATRGKKCLWWYTGDTILNYYVEFIARCRREQFKKDGTPAGRFKREWRNLRSTNTSRSTS